MKLSYLIPHFHFSKRKIGISFKPYCYGGGKFIWVKFGILLGGNRDSVFLHIWPKMWKVSLKHKRVNLFTREAC